jgi:hypothetical protein
VTSLPSDRALLFEIVDRLERLEHRLAHGRSAVTELWRTKRELAADLGVSVRWLEERMAEGLPRREIAGKVLFQRAVVEGWLRRRGLLREVG